MHAIGRRCWGPRPFPRWGVVAGVALALVLGVRAALPLAAEWAAEREAQRRLCGTLHITDVDFDLLHGAIALDGASLWSSDPTETRPVLEVERLVAHVSWGDLLERDVKLLDLEVHRPDLRLRRDESGAWNLLSLVCSEKEDAEPAGEDAAPAGRWSFALDEGALSDGRIRFRDLNFESPLQWRASLDELVVRRVGLAPGTYTEPASFSLEGGLDGAPLAIQGELWRTQNERRVSLDLTLEGARLGQASAYLSQDRTRWLQAKVDLDLHLEDAGSDSLTLSGDVTLRELMIDADEAASGEPAALRAQEVRLGGARLDLSGRRLELQSLELAGVELPVRPRAEDPLPLLAELPFGREKPKAAAPVSEASRADDPWSLRVGSAELRESAVLLPEQALRLAVSGRLDGLDTDAAGGPARLALDAQLQEPGREEPSRRGRLVLAGSLQLEPLRFEGEATVADFAFDRRDGRTPCVAAFESLRLEEVEAEAPGSLAVGALLLVQPELRLTRDGESGFRCTLAGDGGEPQDEPSGPDPQGEPAESDPEREPLELALRVANARVERGRLALLDRRVEPFFETRLEPLDAKLAGLGWPALEIESFDLSSEGLGRKPVQLRGSLTDGLLRADLRIDRAELARFNPYLSKHARLQVDEGEGSATLEARIEPERVAGDLHLVLHDLGLAAGAGTRRRDALGTSLPLALALLRNPRGDIVVDVPFSQEKGLARVDLVSVFASSLHRALFNAVLTPLKLIGAVVVRDGRIERIEPEPVGFLPGRAVLDPQGEAQIAKLADLLVRRPWLAVRLEPRVVGEDARWLRERVQTPPPGGEEPFVWRGDPARLAAERGARLARLLAQRHGVKGGRVVVAAASDQLGNGAPRVELRLQPIGSPIDPTPPERGGLGTS
jgi:hypothetical protein